MATPLVDAVEGPDEVHVQHPNGRPADTVVPCGTRLQDAPFPAKLLDELTKAGFTTPTPIQRYSWPLALAKHDFIGLAKTGSGKTLAFLLPAFQRILSEGSRNNVQVQLLTLAPTRELAMQIEETAMKFGRPCGIRSLAVYGGVPRGPQVHRLRSWRPQCVVACPGRLNDLLSWGQIDLAQVSMLVVDEADRLLDMGFEPQVRQVLSSLPPAHQSLLFSATWPEEVRKLAADILRQDHLELHIGRAHELRGNESVAQTVLVLPDAEAKEAALLDQLRSCGADEKALVFCTTRASCDCVRALLVAEGVSCAATHAELEQSEREQTLRSFRSGALRVLVATDLAARGLDIQGVALVINFEPPHSYKVEDYVHRIGRTGRAGRRGRAVTFLTPKEVNQARAIVEVMRRTGEVPSAELEALAAQARGSAKDRRAEARREFLRQKQDQAEAARVRRERGASGLVAWLLRAMAAAFQRWATRLLAQGEPVQCSQVGVLLSAVLAAPIKA